MTDNYADQQCGVLKVSDSDSEIYIENATIKRNSANPKSRNANTGALHISN